MDEKKRIVNLQILGVVVSLNISDKNEEIVRNAAKKLNDRAKDIKEKNPTFKLGEKYFHIHTTEYNQAVISYLGENYVPEEDDYCIELSE